MLLGNPKKQSTPCPPWRSTQPLGGGWERECPPLGVHMKGTQPLGGGQCIWGAPLHPFLGRGYEKMHGPIGDYGGETGRQLLGG